MTNYTGRIQLASKIEAASPEQKTIAGVIATYGEDGYAAQGGHLRLMAGALEMPENLSDIRLNLEHDKTRPIGRMMLANPSDKNIQAVFHIADTTNGRDALAEAKAGLRDGLSIEADIVEATYGQDGALEISKARLTGVGLVAYPGIRSARVSDIAASEADDAPAAPAEPETPTEEAAEVETPNQEETVEETTTELAAAPAVIPTATIAASAPKLPSVGEVLLAAREGRVEAALAQQKLADNAGVVPTEIMLPLVDTVVESRPIVDAFPLYPMPAVGKQWTRPKITQHTTVGLQANELAELSSQKMTITGLTVTKGTYGGAVTLSVQDSDWTTPSMLNILAADLVKSAVLQTESAAAAALVAAVAQTEALPANATAAQWTTAIYNAAKTVIAAVGEAPDVIVCAPNMWARLGSLVDGQNRPLFPTLGAVNAPGTMEAISQASRPWGLKLVVSKALADGKCFVGNSKYFENYESEGGQMSLPSPSTLGFDISYYRFFSSLVTEANAFVSLQPAA